MKTGIRARAVKYDVAGVMSRSCVCGTNKAKVQSWAVLHAGGAELWFVVSCGAPYWDSIGGCKPLAALYTGILVIVGNVLASGATL